MIELSEVKGIGEILAVLMDTLNDFVCIKDSENRWLAANTFGLKLFKLENVDYKGKTDKDFAEMYPFFREAFLECYDSDNRAWDFIEGLRLEERIQTDDGIRYFDVMKVPTFNEDGSRKALVTIGRDITQRKLKEELLRKSEKLAAIGELAAGVAHEIRNPLTALKGFVQVLQPSLSEQRNYLSIMQAELERIEAITGDLLILAKPQVKTYQKTDIEETIRHVIALLEPEIKEKQIKLSVAFNHRGVALLSEADQLKQAFINVVKNAIDSMENGEIVISSKAVDGRLIIMIEDQGCGIAEERLAKLGEPFYSTKEKGTGLGLMVTFKIIKEHKGEIKFDSELGKGTKVTIGFPIT